MEMAEGEVGVCPSSLSSALFSRKREAHFFFLLTSQFYSKEIRKYLAMQVLSGFGLGLGLNQKRKF